MPEAIETKVRSLSGVLLRLTFVITLSLGLAAAIATIWVDLKREKDAVENLAYDFMQSAAPSAAAAAYNFDDEAAKQVANGLFLKRAIIAISIINDGEVMVAQQRQVDPTLPQFLGIGARDEIELSQQLFEPGEASDSPPIGELSIKVDKSLVAPEIVARLFTFFVVTTAKNAAFGLILFWAVFHVLTRHISALTRSIQMWQPGSDRVQIPTVPGILRDTEVASLGEHVSELTELANGALNRVRRSHDHVVGNNQVLSERVKDRTLELERANRRLRRMADHDALTGLFNRASFDRLLAERFTACQHSADEVAVLLIDVDHFKPFNDFYGHQAGDAALVRLAELLRDIQNETGCIMTRYGGEEFVCILRAEPGTPEVLAARVHAALETAPIEHQHSTVARRITVSIGIASTAEKEAFTNADMLVSAADDALYEAKHAGRNCTVSSSAEIRQRAHENRLSVKALLDATDAKEFEPFGQPQVDARTGALIGVEALVRWIKPDGTIVPPGQFLPIAERSGLITQIDTIVLEKLSAFLAQYPDALPSLSINVSGESLASEGYLDRILELARASQTRITVELLETAFIDRPDELLLWQLETLRDAGVAVEIDDFGTGRTSILGLMAISPDRLKVARELILPLGKREGQTKLVTSVIDIAASLEMNVLAEGVETEEIARLLIDIGCPIQQGYLHGKPMPLEDLLQSLGPSPRKFQA
ncbi:MAG: bifunctional diguanylate cyclase/phosphodiesterase [Pseudomonadota bacterium]